VSVFTSGKRPNARRPLRRRCLVRVTVVACPTGLALSLGRQVEMTARLTLAAAAASETGLVRENNEDAAYSGHWLFAVADGLGGHAAGEVASAAVIESLSSHDAEVAPDILLETFGLAIAEANREIARQVAVDPSRKGMGTTLTAMLWSGDYAALAHIGDSRAFRLREGRLHQITEDHTIGNLVSDADFLAPVLSRHLDGRPDRSPDLSLRELQVGDRYLLCSDGLSPVVSSGAIQSALVSTPTPLEAVRQLCALVEEAGGPDNFTMIVIDVQLADSQLELAEPSTLGSASARSVAH